MTTYENKYFPTTFIQKRESLKEFNIYLSKINTFEFVIKLKTTIEENINLSLIFNLKVTSATK